jgi:hypothetical protein
MAELRPSSLTRAEFAKLFNNDQRAIRAFEALFDLIPSDLIALETSIEETEINAGIADAKATQASGMVIRLKEEAENAILGIETAISKANMATGMSIRLEEALQPALLGIGTIEAKANQAIGGTIRNEEKINSNNLLSWLSTE